MGDLRRRGHAPVPRPRVAARRAAIAETDALDRQGQRRRADDNKDLERALHAAIKKVTQAVTDLRFNTAIAEMMMFVNEATKAAAVPRAWFEMFVKILSPFAPHVAEELWQRLGHTHVDRVRAVAGARRGQARARRDGDRRAGDRASCAARSRCRSTRARQAILAAAKADDKVQSFLEGKPIKREIYVKGRLVNLVV